jgi:hypothetical protein
MHLHKNLMSNNNMVNAQICEIELRLVPSKLDHEMVCDSRFSKMYANFVKVILLIECKTTTVS